MICPSSPQNAVGRRNAAFTLIELLTVISIILVLAGLLLHVAGNANYKASLARAETEIKAMSTALESYKADNGAYPRNDITDTPNAQITDGASPSAPSTYNTSCEYLYQCLSGYNGTTTYGKHYMDFVPGQLSTGSATPSMTTTFIIDPFGICYGYSTINQKAQEAVNSGGTPPVATSGYNPTFDLWSTGGYGSGGKQYPSGASTGSAAVALWAKNW